MLAKFDFRLQVSHRKQGLVLTWDYNRDLFYHETIEWLAENFDRLLDCMLASPLNNVTDIFRMSDKPAKQRISAIPAPNNISNNIKQSPDVSQTIVRDMPSKTASMAER